MRWFASELTRPHPPQAFQRVMYKKYGWHGEFKDEREEEARRSPPPRDSEDVQRLCAARAAQPLSARTSHGEEDLSGATSQCTGTHTASATWWHCGLARMVRATCSHAGVLPSRRGCGEAGHGDGLLWHRRPLGAASHRTLLARTARHPRRRPRQPQRSALGRRACRRPKVPVCTCYRAGRASRAHHCSAKGARVPGPVRLPPLALASAARLSRSHQHKPRVSSLAPCADSAPPRMTTTCSARSMSRWSKCTWRCLAFRSARAAAAAAPARRRAAVPPARGASALTRTCNALACTVRLELIDATESGVTSDEDKKKLDQERAECACSRPHAALSHHPRARHRHRHRVCCLELVEPCLAVDAGRALAAIPRAWSILVPACARWGVVQ